MLHSAPREESDYVGLNKTPASKSFLSWMMDDEQEERGGRGRGESKTTETRRGERACKTKNKTESKRAASKCTK